MRLIDADAEAKALNVMLPNMTDPSDKTAVEFARNVLEGAPTIDAVPVVRCSECEFGDPVWMDQGYWEPPTCDGIRCTRFADTAMDYDDYCSYGKRKEEST